MVFPILDFRFWNFDSKNRKSGSKIRIENQDQKSGSKIRIENPESKTQKRNSRINSESKTIFQMKLLPILGASMKQLIFGKINYDLVQKKAFVADNC